MAAARHPLGARGIRIVRLWFGAHCISECRAEARIAGRYTDEWRRRFPGLQITDDPAALAPAVRS